MKKYLTILFVALCNFGYGQVTWKQSTVRLEKNIFQVHLTAIIESPWHIYSQNLPPGGPVATKITFNGNPGITLTGKVLEKGKLIVRHESVFDMDVKYFQDQVDFSQIIKVSNYNQKKLNAQVEFMLCDNNRCLPPTSATFTFIIP